MRKLILLGTLCYISTCTLAQSIDSLVEIKGFYVTQFLKQELVFSYEQNIKKVQKKSYTIPMDYSRCSFFIPIQIGNKVVCEQDSIIKKFLNCTLFKPSDSVYVFPNNDSDFLKQRNIVTTDISKEICIMNAYESFSPFYEISESNEYLIKCVYIEGYALHKHIQEIEKKWQNYFWNIFHGGKYNENGEFFFIVKINNYTPYIELPGLKKWLPYLGTILEGANEK